MNSTPISREEDVNKFIESYIEQNKDPYIRL